MAPPVADDEKEEQEVDPRNLLVPELHAGARCETVGNRRAIVRYVGGLHNVPKSSTASQGYWVGVQYDDKVGKNDGRLYGRRYFRCPPGHGGFIRATKVKEIEDETAPADKKATTPPHKRLGLPGEMPRAAEDPSFLHMDMTLRDPAQAPIVGVASSRASRVASRRQAAAKERSLMLLSASGGGGSSPKPQQHRRQLGEDGAVPEMSRVAGSGIDISIVGFLAQFTILACDANGDRLAKGSSSFTVTMRGIHTPALVRTKVIDRNDGSYVVEYRPWLTGAFEVGIMLSGYHIHVHAHIHIPSRIHIPSHIHIHIRRWAFC